MPQTLTFPAASFNRAPFPIYPESSIHRPDVGGDIETDGGDAGPGSGAIAHGKGATAAGKGAVIVKGNVTGGISTSNKKKPHA